MPSEVARFRKQIDATREAGKRGLTGFAQVARHRFITKRMEHQADDFQKLVNRVRKEEACKQLFGVVLPEEEKQAIEPED